MVSLWGSNKDNGQGRAEGWDRRPPEDGGAVGDGYHDTPGRRSLEQADERTRLLGPGDRAGYLSPDDPAVSPYNLWTVRALRQLSLLFLALSFVWWIFLLVSTFVSPPLMHPRGSGFLSFSYTTLTVGQLLISLLFFTVPSRPMTIWGAVLAVLLAVDVAIIVGVPRIRVEEGWVGIASAAWAAAIAVYNVVRDRSVAWGKREEEERLTGREETRRSMGEWMAVLLQLVAMGVLAIVALLLTATLILRARDASLAPPGQRYLVDRNRYQVHLACVGNITTTTTTDEGHNNNNNTPTILLEAGEGPARSTATATGTGRASAGRTTRPRRTRPACRRTR
ncbi:hypothetical protein VTN02DRAFT_2981 [Thermoascus thermophilus]